MADHPGKTSLPSHHETYKSYKPGLFESHQEWVSILNETATHVQWYLSSLCHQLTIRLPQSPIVSVNDIVACRPVAGQWPWDKQIYNSHHWVTPLQTNIFPRKRLNHNNEMWCFLCSPCRGVISRASWEVQLVSQWREDLEFGVRWPPACELVLGYLPASTDINRGHC
jgi:hypothetical protein